MQSGAGRRRKIFSHGYFGPNWLLLVHGLVQPWMAVSRELGASAHESRGAWQPSILSPAQSQGVSLPSDTSVVANTGSHFWHNSSRQCGCLLHHWHIVKVERTGAESVHVCVQSWCWLKVYEKQENLIGFGQNLTSFKFSTPKPLSLHKPLFLSLI